jgi:putative tryptophan/tyrosine transport system substrate-binding protein
MPRRPIPVVFAGVGANLAPTAGGGNLTGVAEQIVELITTGLDLLKEAVPGLARVAILANRDNHGTPAYLQQSRTWGQTAGVMIHVYEVRDPKDIPPAFVNMRATGFQGLPSRPASKSSATLCAHYPAIVLGLH